jgi:two-component system, OmpR family, sensor histidine kinase CpxA
MRLFLRIFLSFWLALALSLTIAILLTIATRPERRISAIEALQPRFLDEAADAYCNGGTDRLEEYLRYLRDTQHTHSMLFDEHGPVVSHPVRPWFTETFEGKRRTADTFLGRISPHFQMLKTEGTGPDGHHYTLVTELPPGQSAIFGPGGLPGLGILIAVLSSGLVCYFLAAYLTSPVLRLRKAAQKLAAGDLSARVGKVGRSKDEVSQLVRDFDTMAEQIEKLVNAQSRLLKDISHELRSPLARMTVALELARQRTGAEAESVLDRISLEASRMNELIGSLTTIARLESGNGSVKKVSVHLEEIVEEVARDADFEAQARNCRVEAEILDELPVEGDPALLRSAIENIVRNATRYTREGTTVKVRAEKVLRQNSMQALINVTDYGPGVPEESLEKIFQPFYRIDDARGRSTGGVGLGLAITDQAVRLHGGSVTASNLPEGGLSVVIRLPLQSKAAGEARTKTAPVATSLD